MGNAILTGQSGGGSKVSIKRMLTVYTEFITDTKVFVLDSDLIVNNSIVLLATGWAAGGSNELLYDVKLYNEGGQNKFSVSGRGVGTFIILEFEEAAIKSVHTGTTTTAVDYDLGSVVDPAKCIGSLLVGNANTNHTISSITTTQLKTIRHGKPSYGPWKVIELR